MKKVLIIDDNTEFVELLEFSLSKSYDITKCFSLADIKALDSDSHFDLILTDYNLGMNNGEKTIDTLKSIINMKDTKIILVSGSISETQQKMVEGIDDYLEKPFSMKSLKDKIKYHLS